ncbi:hypothetical protein GCM10027035_25870 [Emticicia sediminis]
MRNFCLISFFFHVFNLVYAQTDIKVSLFERYSRVGISNVVVDKDDNIIMSGFYVRSSEYSTRPLVIENRIIGTTNNNERGLFCVKLNRKKEVVWSKLINGTGYFSTALAKSSNYALVDDSSNVYLVGKFSQKLVFDEKNILDSPTGDIYIAKYSSDGSLKWAKKYVGSSDDGTYLPKIDNKGNIYIIGSFKSALEVGGKEVLKATGLNAEPYLLKLDRNGNYIFAKAFNQNLEVSAISINDMNEIFLAGNFQGTIALNESTKIQSAGMADIFYAKYNADGQILWVKTIGGALRDDTHNIEADAFGNVYVAGVVTNDSKFDTLQVKIQSLRGANVFLTKIDGNKGQISWVKNMTYGNDLYDYFNYHNTVKLLKLNNAGEPYIFGVVTDFMRVNSNLELKPNTDNGRFSALGYFIKFDKKGDLSFAQSENSQIGDDFSIWNSMEFDSNQSLLYISGDRNYISGGLGGIVQSGFLKTKTELNQRSCNSQISISGNSTLSLNESIINNGTFGYQWYKNGEYIPNANNATFQAKEAGYYSLKLINKSNSSCQISSSNSIPIFPITSNFPVVLTVSNSTQSTLDIISSSALSQKTEWYLDNRLLVNNNFFYVYTTDGTYKVKQYFANGVVKESNEVNVNDGIAFSITKSTTYDDGDICKPMPNLIANISKQTLQNENLKYQWYLNGNAVNDSIFNHFRAITSGEYYATIFVPSMNKTYTTGKYRTVIEDFPKSLPITKIEDICGAKALLKVDDSFIQRYGFQSIIWRVDDKVIAEATQPFYNANKGGYYTFSVQYKEPNTGKTCTYNSFTTFEKKNDFKLNLGYAYAGSGCVVDSFKVFTEQNARYSYTWTKNDIPIEKQTSSEIFIKDKARYKAIVKRNDGCVNETDEISLKGCTSDESERFLLLNPPKITADKTSFFSDGKTLLSFGGCSNVNIQWLKNDQVIAGANQENLEVKEGGNYALQIEKFGCKTTTNTIKISVETILAVGEENPNFNIEVYPNPTEEKLFISIPPQINIPIDVKMIDISGKLMENYDFSTSNNKYIDLKSFQTGIYYLVFEMQGKRIVKKIIKNN